LSAARALILPPFPPPTPEFRYWRGWGGEGGGNIKALSLLSKCVLAGRLRFYTL